MERIGVERVTVVFVIFILAFAGIVSPQTIKAADKPVKMSSGDDFSRILKVNWKMKRSDIAKLFSWNIPGGAVFFYAKSSLARRDAGIGVEFDRLSGRVVQVTMGIPTGDLSLEDNFILLEELKKVIAKKFGRPLKQLKGKDADRFMRGLVAYYYWRRRNTEVVLLVDTDRERMMRIVSAAGEPLKETADNLGNKGRRGIAVVLRRADYFKR